MVYGEPNARTQRRQARAVALHEAEAGAVGLHGGRGADRQIVDALQPVQANEEWRCGRHGWHGLGWDVEEEAKAVEEAGSRAEAEAEADAQAQAEVEVEVEAEVEARTEREAKAARGGAGGGGRRQRRLRRGGSTCLRGGSSCQPMGAMA